MSELQNEKLAESNVASLRFLSVPNYGMSAREMSNYSWNWSANDVFNIQLYS